MDKSSVELPKVNLSTLPKYEENPFIQELKGKMYLKPRNNTIIKQGQQIIDSDTGEIVEDGVLIGTKHIVDRSQFAKVYASEIGLLFDLSKPAIKVFMYLAKVMGFDQRAYFNYFRDHEKVGYKNYSTCYKGLLDLLSKDIIALDVRENTYWMNPTIVCKGERFAIYTEWVTKERHEKDEKARMRKKELAQQTSDYYENLDEDTQRQLYYMEKAEERKER